MFSNTILLQIQPATATSFLHSTSIAHQPIHVKPKSSKSKLQHQNVRISIKQAPRAKPYNTLPIDSSQSIQNGLQNSATPSDQLQPNVETQKLPKTIIQDDETNLLHKTPLQNALKILPLQQDNPIPQVSIANPLPQNSPRLLPLLTTGTSSIPTTAPSIALGNIQSRSVVPIQQISSDSLWFNDTLPSFGTVFLSFQILFKFPETYFYFILNLIGFKNQNILLKKQV